jgi:hypothetical protein
MNDAHLRQLAERSLAADETIPGLYDAAQDLALKRTLLANLGQTRKPITSNPHDEAPKVYPPSDPQMIEPG